MLFSQITKTKAIFNGSLVFADREKDTYAIRFILRKKMRTRAKECEIVEKIRVVHLTMLNDFISAI